MCFLVSNDVLNTEVGLFEDVTSKIKDDVLSLEVVDWEQALMQNRIIHKSSYNFLAWIPALYNILVFLTICKSHRKRR